MGYGRDPVHHGDGELGADADHAAVPARARRHDPSRVAIWAGVLAGSTSFVAAFASPIWGRLSDRHGRKMMLIRSSLAIGDFYRADGRRGQCLADFRVSRADGGVRRVFRGGDRAGREPGAGGPARLFAGLAQTGQLVGSLVGPIIGGLLADLTGSYRIPFYCTSARSVRGDWGWSGSSCRRSSPDRKRAARRGSTLSGLVALARSPALLALFFVLMMAQFGVRTVQPIVTLYVQEMVGDLPNIATLAGIAFSITGLANVVRGAVSRHAQRPARVSPRAADLPRRRRADDAAAGFRRQLLAVHRLAVRRRAVHRRPPADGQRDGRRVWSIARERGAVTG